nr:phospholipase-like protein [Tanacetum cinerariifolium]
MSYHGWPSWEELNLANIQKLGCGKGTGVYKSRTSTTLLVIVYANQFNILACNQQRRIETELALCDKKIQAIMNGESSLQQSSALKLPRVTSNRFFKASFMLQWHFLPSRRILSRVILGTKHAICVEDRRHVPNWILRLANDRVSWNNYPWGSYVWPTLYKHLRDANVKRWQPLYASEPANETDTKSYSIEGFAWAFKGQLPVQRLVPDETEARSRWWVSSRAYFDGSSFEEEQIPRQLNQNNYFEVPSEMYRYFEEQRRGYQQLKEKNADMYEKLTRFIENTRRVPEAHTIPIIANQHFGVSDMSRFQSYQGAPSAFNTLANNSSYFNMPTPNQSNWLSPSNWQTPNQSYLGTLNSQPLSRRSPVQVIGKTRCHLVVRMLEYWTQ